MKSDLSLDERPRQRRPKRLLNGHSPPLKTPGAALSRSLPGSSMVKVLRRLDQLSEAREYLYCSPISKPPHDQQPPIPRYVFVGDQPGESQIRLGIFAEIKGPDHAGCRAIADFIADLVNFPSLGSAFRIYAYPRVDPGSFATPPKRTDHRLLDETRRNLKPVEASIIERELFVVQFQGLIVVQTAEENEGFQVTIDNPNLHDVLVLPIVEALQSAFPTMHYTALDSSWSIVADSGLKQKPFKLTLRTPRSAWESLYAIGLRIALHTAIDCYRSYLAQANNI
jgi:hypothetical protein